MDTFRLPEASGADRSALIEKEGLFKLTYGLFVLSARIGARDNACIVNTVAQLTDNPRRISVAVNKSGYTHDMIAESGVFNVSVLAENAPFSIFKRFGFQSGRDADKFDNWDDGDRTVNGLRYVAEYSNAVLSGKVVAAVDCGTHTLFIADVTEAKVLSKIPSVTYAYYFAHIKPGALAASAPAPKTVATDPAAAPGDGKPKKKRWVCRICGFVYEGDELPADFICPLCGHGADDFELME